MDPATLSSGSSRSNTACISGHTPAPARPPAPHSGHASARVHSRYQRRLADAAIGGQRVVLRLGVRRFFCDHHDCQARTFTEQLPGLTTRYARRTPLLRTLRELVALALQAAPAPGWLTR
jgi:hypothetical protein